MDNNQATLLVMLDISAAYDTISHDIFLERLQSSFGIQGVVLMWMKSYLKDRTNQVVIGDERSYASSPTSGAAQGSVMGGKCYNMYTRPLGKAVKNPLVKRKAYADDNSLYVAFTVNDNEDLSESIKVLENCLCWGSVPFGRNNNPIRKYALWLRSAGPDCKASNTKNDNLKSKTIFY